MSEELVNGELNPEHYTSIVPMLNIGVLKLFTRFNVRQDQVIIRLSDTITRYKLHPDHSLMNTTSTLPKYIHDSVDYPFVANTLIKILSIHNEIGEERFMNTENNHWSLSTPAYNVIQHPYPDQDNALSVIYQASLPEIPVSDSIDPSSIDVEIPPMFLEPLCYFIGSRIHIGLNDQETYKEAEYYGKLFNVEASQIRKQQHVQTEHDINTKLEMNGWH